MLAASCPNMPSSWHHGLIELVMENAPISGAVGGAAQPQLTLDGLSSVPVVIPPASSADRLSRLLQPMYALVCSLEMKNVNLGTQRDLLLPKLVSGEIDLGAAEEKLEAAE
jgi:type I restriction enzyme S subunit